MIVALIDNGSLEPAAQLNLRAVAAALSRQTGVVVHPVSWKHSDRVPVAALDGQPAATLVPWIRAQLARGESTFIFVPFFISAQGAIGSALDRDVEKLRAENAGGKAFEVTFTPGLTRAGALLDIVVDRIRETLAARVLPPSTPVVLVDHGGPSADSARLRDSLAGDLRMRLGSEIGALTAASMEGAHGPLLTEVLASSAFERGPLVIAPLFLSPGRHAGPNGDIAGICREAEGRAPALRCHPTGLVGTHRRAVDALALALRETLVNFPASLSA